MIGLAFCIAAFAMSAAAQTGTVPLDAGTPPSGLTNSSITELSGNVGIGTTSPGGSLSVAADDTLSGGSGYSQFQIVGKTDSTKNFLVGLDTTNNAAYLQTLHLGVVWGAYPLALQPFAGSVGIGIGTTSPGAKLEVGGSIKLTANSGGSITFQDGSTQSTAYTGVICGGDYAESVDVTGNRTKYEPGDVLVLDVDSPGKMLKSIEAYSTAVSGIYSTKPGTVGRRQTTAKSPDEVPMAVIGIVPAKVSAENGPIKVGDLLVTSSTPGYAMKGTDRSRMLGAVVGKAMAKLDSGTGVIEVLVTLQ
jgi:hypothetical protein